ncbi:MAG: IS605 OrfB-like transposable element containing RNAse H-like and Zn finger domain [Candidatus Methanohalarchaeum thermophilum]|uniref:IS605 OrfB-like transposable element containing RNAse H-like and Zn finger domain n=1 Tax=Methanohalarchaeum thermophilum TaxID=1903181 RepID=A0A1Q6DXF8_METT1|nr:MAG: IS605 OrfB-like transposable element containing RNAse H-like and Zn finger domain [Candidatus Methanohalarchaeum thermophilum]
MDGEDSQLYSATKQQARRVVIQNNPEKKQPIRLRNDVIKLEEQDTEISSYWVKIPVYNPEKGRGESIWCPAIIPRKDREDVKECEFGDSELVKHEEDWFVHLVIKREVELETIRPDCPSSFSDVIAIDMGVRWVVMSVALLNCETKFYGEEVREIREHYKMLRKKIGKKKVRKGKQVIKKIGNKESRKVEDRLHKISREIVEDAKERDAIIAIGDLRGIREQEDKGRKFNDKLHKFPFDKLKRFIEYKAEWEGIRVIEVDERDTSKTCNRCGSQNTKRVGQGKFVCRDCGLEDNADKNGASNIAKRALGKSIRRPLSEAGALLAVPRTPAEKGEAKC